MVKGRQLQLGHVRWSDLMIEGKPWGKPVGDQQLPGSEGKLPSDLILIEGKAC